MQNFSAHIINVIYMQIVFNANGLQRNIYVAIINVPDKKWNADSPRPHCGQAERVTRNKTEKARFILMFWKLLNTMLVEQDLEFQLLKIFYHQRESTKSALSVV